MSVEVYVEVGQTRTFATALEWRGWCRSGRDEASALASFAEYGLHYPKVLKTTRLKFSVPTAISSLVVVERLSGKATTNFGAPNFMLPGDIDPVDPPELERWHELLPACWHAFDQAVQAADRRCAKVRAAEPAGLRATLFVAWHGTNWITLGSSRTALNDYARLRW